jgi:crossover junction endodeoxyribonuclease RuvC
VTAADRKPALVECGAIHTTGKRSLAERLLEIFQGLTAVIDRARPDVLCVEGVFHGRNARTTVVLGHARGAVLLAAAARGIPVEEYPPAEVKSAVAGSGMASKDQVAFMVQKHLSLDQPPAPQDAADGVALALCHIFRGGSESRAGIGGGVGRKRS